MVNDGKIASTLTTSCSLKHVKFALPTRFHFSQLFFMIELSPRRNWAVRTQRSLWIEDANSPLIPEDSFTDGSPEATWRHQAATSAQQWAASQIQMSRTHLEVSNIIQHDGPPDLRLDQILHACKAITLKIAIRKQED